MFPPEIFAHTSARVLPLSLPLPVSSDDSAVFGDLPAGLGEEPRDLPFCPPLCGRELKFGLFFLPPFFDFSDQLPVGGRDPGECAFEVFRTGGLRPGTSTLFSLCNASRTRGICT